MEILIFDSDVKKLEQEGCSLPLNVRRSIDPRAWGFRIGLGYAQEHNLQPGVWYSR